MHTNIKNLPKLKLVDLLHRRKTTLSIFVKESGIHAYSALVERCRTLGVQPPSEDIYNEILPKHNVSSPQDGIVVLEPISNDEEIKSLNQIEIDSVFVEEENNDEFSYKKKKRSTNKKEMI